MSGLSVSDVVNVSVSMSPSATSVRNFGALLIVGESTVISVAERRRAYSTLAAVAADFGTLAAEYLAAKDFFAQSPQPAQCYIGRWDHTNETLAACITAHLASSDWYALVVADTLAVTADYLAVAALIEASNPARVFGVTTQDPNAIVAASTTDIAAQVAAAKYGRTCVQYSSTDPYAVASLLARQCSVDFTANNSTITLAFKQEPGVTPETLSETQAAALKAKNCNVFVNYSNSTAIIQNGTMANGAYIDEVFGTDWLANDLQATVFSALYGSTTKIPQTDAGVNQLLTAAAQSCGRARANGLIGPGVWTGPTLGSLKTGDTLTDGFYLYAAPIASQSAAARQARQAPTIQAAIKLAGAVHTANVIVNVNR
jgi:hypothetical protein